MRHILLNNEVVRRDNGFFQIHKDIEAAEAFKQYVSERSPRFSSIGEKIRWMIDNNYYVDFEKAYNMDDVVALFSSLYERKFKFQSYMAISKFYNQYAIRSNDQQTYFENYEDRIACNALKFAKGDIQKARLYAEVLIEQLYQPATPTFLNSSRARGGQHVSCFLLSVDDDKHSISYVQRACLYLSSIGGGVAFNLSRLRARNEAIKGIEGVAKGVLPVAKMYETNINYADQEGSRDGSGAAYLHIFHMDIQEFLNSKQANADESSRLQTLSLGLIIPSKFFELAEKGKTFYAFGPHSIYKEYGVHLDDMNMDEWYDKLAENPRVKKEELDGREILTKIAIMQKESGYPYLMFKDNANRLHALKDIGEVKMSNLCTEIYQIQEVSSIFEYHIEDIIRRDVSCNLGSLNTTNVMESKKFRHAVHTAVEMLTEVSDDTSIDNVPSIKKANEELHSIGLGFMNLHGYLAKNLISYESKEARDFARTYAMMMNYYSLEKSMLIAKERGVTFKGFEKSEYKKGTYFKKYLKINYAPQTEKVKTLFAGMEIPTPEDWARLMEMVQKYGIYHAYRLATAPTGSISYLQNATASVMPIVEVIEERREAKQKTFYPMPYLNEQNLWHYKSAYNMDQKKIIDMVAVIQEHVDQGISCTLFSTSAHTTRDLTELYIYAHKKGLKALYFTRNKSDRKVSNGAEFQECVNCAV